METDRLPEWDEVDRARAAGVIDQAFLAAQLGMPAEDHETAVDALRIILDALLVDHLAPDDRTIDDRADRRVAIGVQWQRMVTTAVTHTFVLGGGFVQPDQLSTAVDEGAHSFFSGSGWVARRRRGHGQLVLRVHDDLSVFERTTRSGRPPGEDDMVALVDLIACAAIGAVMDRPTVPDERSSIGRSRARWNRDPRSVAAAFGIPGANLVEVTRHGWVCDECGCLFAGRVEGTTAYPDRFAPVGRNGPCDGSVDCSCHAAPVQRNVR